MQHILARSCRTLALCLLPAISSVIPVAAGAGQALSAEHQWDKPQRALLRNLWLGSLTARKDPGNRVSDDPVAVRLGQRIFFDKRFSADGRIACASCHQAARYFTDGRKVASGLTEGTRNTPTIVGSSVQTWFFHDGRADSLWSQALGPLENAKEHGGARGQYARLVFDDPQLRKNYEKLFGKLPELGDEKRFPPQASPVGKEAAVRAWQIMHQADQKAITEIFVNLGKAIAAYEAQLQPGPSRFDRYVEAMLADDLAGMRISLNLLEVKGLRIFIGKGNCLICHSGPMFTDMSFHNVAIPPRQGNQYDWGRYTGAAEVLKSPFNCRSEFNDATDKSCAELEYISLDKHETLGAMKTPGLRNVSKTAPYMHAGQYQTLREVIQHYNDPPNLKFRQSDLFLDVDLSDADIDALEAFLRSLDSDIGAEPGLLAGP